MSVTRRAITFACADATLAGVVHVPSAATLTGVVVVVGGPQYRVGSHRQFVHLADDLAAAGFAALRFDYRGMGDSDGERRDFEAVEADITAAIGALRATVPGLTAIVLWGLCDAATASAFYVGQGNAVAGVVLANPWVRTEAGLARSYVEHYYGKRLLDAGFWRRLLSGRMPVWRRLREFVSDLRRASAGSGPAAADESRAPLPVRVRTSLDRYAGPVLLLMSGADLTAREFDQHWQAEEWRGLRGRPGMARVDLADADHTFSQPGARAAVSAATINWLNGLPRP